MSTRIEEFKRTGDLGRLEAALRAAGGPLTEPAGEDVLVTFVWIGPQRQVSVRGAQLFEDRNAISHPMNHVEGTEVWHLDVVAPRGVATVYQYLVDDPFQDADMTDLAPRRPPRGRGARTLLRRPVQPRRLYPQTAMIAGVMDAPAAQWDSVLELPGLEPTPWFAGEAPALTEIRLTSEALGNERGVHVFTPGGDGPYPLVVLLDGESWVTVARLHTAIAALIGAGEMAPAVVAFVENPPGSMSARMTEMACHPAMTRMLADELLPLLRAKYALTGDVVIGGNSLGGLASAFAALQRPDVFSGVLSTSGSFWWGYLPVPGGWGKDGEPEWLHPRVRRRAPRPGPLLDRRRRPGDRAVAAGPGHRPARRQPSPAHRPDRQGERRDVPRGPRRPRLRHLPPQRRPGPADSPAALI